MSFNISPFHARKSDGILRVLILGRISTIHQNIENIAASQDASERRIREMYSGEMIITRLGDRGSGWRINRSAITEAERMIAAGEIDVVIMEELSRAWRNPEYQYKLAHMCRDSGVRLICWGDGIDTANPNWEIILPAAVLQHGMLVPITRRRVRRTADHNFQNGGMVLKIPFGYRRVSAEEAKQGNGERIAKIPKWTEVIREMARRFLAGQSCASIARWLRDTRVPTGEYVETGRWSGKLVAELLENPLLRGVRFFRVEEFQIIYRTGDHKRIPNPTPERRDVPELAHLTAEEHAAVLKLMGEEAEARKRPNPNGRMNVPRKCSYWPGQHLRCGICGDECYWLSRGQLRCQNASSNRPRSCWNRTVIQAKHVREKLLPLILTELRKRPAHWDRFVSLVWAEFERALSGVSGKKECLQSEIRSLQGDVKQLGDLVLKTKSDEFLGRLAVAEAALKARKAELADLESEAKRSSEYRSRHEVEGDIDNAVQRLAETSYDFDDLLRRLLPDFVLIPVQALDSGQVRPRIRLSFPAESAEEGMPPLVLELDAFDHPLQVRLAKPVAELKTAHPEWTFQRIAQELGAHKKLAWDAWRYWQLMEAAGQTVPYRVLTEPPENASRWGKSSDEGSAHASEEISPGLDPPIPDTDGSVSSSNPPGKTPKKGGPDNPKDSVA